MKKIVSFLLLLLVLPATLVAGSFVQVDQADVMLINSIARFIDMPPEGLGLTRLEQSLENTSPVIRGLAAIILFKHHKNTYIQPFLKAFTLNERLDDYHREGRTLIRLELLNKVMQPLEGLLLEISDERVRRLLLFYHFRHKNLWLVGGSGEKLSLALFYRISTFASILGQDIDVTALTAQADAAIK